jgi:hypothetical protein
VLRGLRLPQKSLRSQYLRQKNRQASSSDLLFFHGGGISHYVASAEVWLSSE